MDKIEIKIEKIMEELITSHAWVEFESLYNQNPILGNSGLVQRLYDTIKTRVESACRKQ